MSLHTDDAAGGLLATRHLIELGHERIAFVGDRPDPAFGFVASTGARRATAARSRTAGIAPPRPSWSARARTAGWSPTGSTRELLSLDEPPTAIFAASDTQARGVLEAAGFEGFDVPGDLSVVGFDDIEVAPYVGLTTVRQPLEESGRRGIECLVGALRDEGEPPAGDELELVLQVRRTTGPPR